MNRRTLLPKPNSANPGNRQKENRSPSPGYQPKRGGKGESHVTASSSRQSVTALNKNIDETKINNNINGNVSVVPIPKVPPRKVQLKTVGCLQLIFFSFKYWG